MRKYSRKITKKRRQTRKKRGQMAKGLLTSNLVGDHKGRDPSGVSFRRSPDKFGGYTKNVKALFWPSKVKPGTVGHKVIVFNKYDDGKFNTFSTILGNHIRDTVIDTEEGLMALSTRFRGKKWMDPEKVMVYGFDFKPGN
jgi:hypothetical protein